MSALHQAVAQAIGRELPRCHTVDGELDLNRVADVAVGVVLAEAQRAIETIEGPEWAEDDYWHGWIAQKREALVVLAALGDAA